jgi:pimeloyl-ACP methyl ester carboxylesterase
VLADMLARQGIASFRFDDRGTGKSKASYAVADLNDFASDVVASIDYFSNQSSFKGHSIGLMGHSEGGMHILLAQNQRKKQVKFMVFLASIGLSGKETLIQQQYEIPLKNGMDETYAKWNKAVFEGLTERVIAEKDQAKCAANLQTFLNDMVMKAPVGTLDTSATGIEAFIKTTTNLMNNDWGRQFLVFNAGDYLKKLNLPVLAVFGSEDAQVNPISNSEAFKRMFTEKQLAQSQIEVLPGLNHLLQTCKKCDVMEYGDLTETMSPLVFSKLVPFIHHL